jgi:thiamine biosynthesis protein ThiS
LEVQEPFFKKVPGRRRPLLEKLRSEEEKEKGRPMVVVNNRDKVEWQEDMTVRDLLNEMGYTYSLITVAVNGELVPREDYEEHPVPDDANVTVFHLAHGG